MFFGVFVDLLIALSTGERAHFRAQTKEKSNVIFVWFSILNICLNSKEFVFKVLI